MVSRTSSAATSRVGRADHEPVDCECSSWPWPSAERAGHRVWHGRWERGVPVPWQLGRDEVIEVTPGSIVPLQRLAYELGRQFQHEFGYDWNPVEVPVRRRREGTYREHAAYFVAIRDRRAIGMAATDVPESTWLWDGVEDRPTVRADRAWVGVAALWVAGGHRRSGVASRLVGRVCAKNGRAPEELAWGWPISPSGLALVRRLVPDGPLLVAP